MTTSAPETVDGFRDIIASASMSTKTVLVCGNQSKIWPRSDTEQSLVSTKRFAGIVDHQASDFTITARAGTPISEVNATLGKAGQYLPFDPAFADRNATVGGLVAAGLNGPCRLRFGGIRDFVIGCQYVDGRGTVVRSGGKVVKNAAGFDTPKYLIGSAGRFGLLLEVTFKVFPRPKQFRTFLFEPSSIGNSVQLVEQLMSLADFEALAIREDNTVAARISGETDAVLHAKDNLVQSSFPVASVMSDEAGHWQSLANHPGVSGNRLLVKVPITRSCLASFDQVIAGLPIERHYGAAGNVALLTLESEHDLGPLHMALVERGLPGQVIVGPSDYYLIGEHSAMSLLRRVKQAMDPAGVLGPIDRFPSRVAT